MLLKRFLRPALAALVIAGCGQDPAKFTMSAPVQYSAEACLVSAAPGARVFSAADWQSETGVVLSRGTRIELTGRVHGFIIGTVPTYGIYQEIYVAATSVTCPGDAPPPRPIPPPKPVPKPAPKPIPKPIPNPQPIPAPQNDVTVLLYHDIVENPTTFDSDVKIERFREQLDYLRQQGYTSITIERYYEFIRNRSPLPKKALIITFDDGYLGEWTLAVPELRKRGLHATFFVHTGYVGRVTEKPHMTWKQLSVLESDPLFSVHSHTVNHLELPKQGPDVLVRELQHSKESLTENLGQRVRFLAYPFGAFNEQVIGQAKQFFGMAFSVDQPAGTWGSYNIPRFIISQNMGLLEFKLKLDRYQRKFFGKGRF